jgi:hypothetical protein
VSYAIRSNFTSYAVDVLYKLCKVVSKQEKLVTKIALQFSKEKMSEQIECSKSKLLAGLLDYV